MSARPSTPIPVRSQFDYYTFMGFNPEELRQRYATYAARFQAGSTVLDVGCGRGEFLELLAAREVKAVGVDADPAMAAECRSKGFEVTAQDAIEYLGQHPAAFDGVFAAHIVEHLRPDRVERLVEVAAGALKPGGRLIVVTPNPHNLQMQLHDFWIDLQHVRFYSPDVLRWILHRAGLHDIEMGENPSYRSGPAIGNSVTEPLPRRSSNGTAARIRRRLDRILLSGSTRRRVAELEQRTNALMAWVQGLYPPAEYFATGLR